MLPESSRSTPTLVFLIGLATSVLCASDAVYGKSDAPTRVPDARALLDAATDFPDPFVLREGNVYYALATNARGHNIQAAKSTDRVSWTQLPDALPRLPIWAMKASQWTWSPSVLRRSDSYILYYTTRDARSGFQCISRAVAAEPAGPYNDDSTAPLVCQVSGMQALCGSIDPSPFIDTDGTAYLYWKSDENSLSCRTTPRVWVQQLATDGLRLIGLATPLFGVDRDWEGHIVEGPSMLLHDGNYFLFYSANWYASSSYAVGYATCLTPTGPCQKVTTEQPWFRSNGGALGPGGQEFFRDSTGQPYMAYHAWTAPNTTYREGGVRSLRVEPIAFAGGVPQVMATAQKEGIEHEPNWTLAAHVHTSRQTN